jgi:hypothetical protein
MAMEILAAHIMDGTQSHWQAMTACHWQAMTTCHYDKRKKPMKVRTLFTVQNNVSNMDENRKS